jgi:heterodisulfide reductase subunit B
MHMMLFYGLGLLLLMQTFAAQITSRLFLFSDYASTHNSFMFLRNLLGMLVLSGVIVALCRRRLNPVLRRSTGFFRRLAWSGETGVRHLLNALTDDVGLERIASKIRFPLRGFRAAAHYGCHALRPADVTQFDNPLAPAIFEQVIGVTGASCVEWPLRLECCGHPLWEKNNRFALALMRRKLADAREAGAQGLITACTYCQIQFGAVRRSHPSGHAHQDRLPAILVSQLLGMALGLSMDTLGVSRAAIPGMVNDK